MGYKSDKERLPREFDQRYKLTAEDEEAIKKMAESGRYTLKSMGDLFGVSKKTVFYVLNPDRKEEQKQKLRKRNTGSNKDSVAKSRKRKHNLLRQMKDQGSGK